MKTKIAIATVSGRAYYELVNELKRKGLPFLSLKPWDPIPLNIKTVITTKAERHLVSHPAVLIFDSESNLQSIIDEAILSLEEKQTYEKIVVGVDPGKTNGIAFFGDDKIIETFDCHSLEETVNVITDRLKSMPARVQIVKVGDGVPFYTNKLLRLLDEILSTETIIELVSESGTSHFMNKTINKRGLRDAMSAIKIAGRNGHFFLRKKLQ